MLLGIIPLVVGPSPCAPSVITASEWSLAPPWPRSGTELLLATGALLVVAVSAADVVTPTGAEVCVSRTGLGELCTEAAVVAAAAALRGGDATAPFWREPFLGGWSRCCRSCCSCSSLLLSRPSVSWLGSPRSPLKALPWPSDHPRDIDRPVLRVSLGVTWMRRRGGGGGEEEV